jgi:hypothetical protein
LLYPDASIHPVEFAKRLSEFAEEIVQLREEQFQAVSSASLRDALHNPAHKGWPRPTVPVGTIIHDYGAAVVPPITASEPEKREKP